jgi:hypothetical protein
LDETIFSSGNGRIAEYLRMVDRIDPDQTARDDMAAFFSVVAFMPTSRRRSDAENTEGGGDCKCEESFLSIHGDLLQLVHKDGCSGFLMRR